MIYKKNIIPRTFLYIILGILVIFFVFPFLWMVVCSFKSANELFALPIKIFPSTWQFKSFFDFWNFGDLNFTRYYINSFIVTAGAVILATIINTMAGYGFAKYKFKGNNLLFMLILSTLMIPFTTIVVPLFILMARLKMTNTYAGLILPMSLNAFGIFLIRQFMFAIPDELIESARIEGAGEFRIFWNIALPIVRGPVIAFIIIQVMSVWNELFWPLIISSSNEMRTVPQAVALFSAEYEQNFIGQVRAATFSCLPILLLYIFLTRYFIQGISMTGLKE